MRANLDLLLDWAQAAGLGELALEHTHTLSSAINLLATPRKNLLQVKDTNHTHTTHSADLYLPSYKSSQNDFIPDDFRLEYTQCICKQN